MYSFLELECAKIYPCSAAHLLVDVEFRDSSAVQHAVAGVGDAAVDCLVGYVDGIFAIFGNVGDPFCGSCCTFPVIDAGDDAGGSFVEGIYTICVECVAGCKAGQVGRCPSGAGLLLLNILRTACAVIVITHSHVSLPVYLARGVDETSFILKHLHKKGDYYRLGEKVLCCAEK